MSRWVNLDDAVYMREDGEYETYNIDPDAPTIKTKQIRYYDEDEQVWKIGEVIVDGEREGE